MSDITIQRDLVYVDDKFNYWQVFTRNKLGLQIYVGGMPAPLNLSYEDIIIKAKKYFKSDIKRFNTSK